MSRCSNWRNPSRFSSLRRRRRSGGGGLSPAEREWTEVFAMQQEIAASIAAKLKVQPANDPPSRRTDNLESYNLYLKGRYYWNKRTVASLEAAIVAFREAIDKDPNYAAAWAG